MVLAHAAAGRYGSERSTLVLASGLLRRGWDVVVLVPEPGPLVEDLHAAGVRVEIVDTGVVRRVDGWTGAVRLAARLPAAVIRLSRRLRGADVVHLNSSVAIAVPPAALLARRPLVFHLRESFRDHARAWRIYSRVLRVCAASVVAVSEDIADEARRAGLGDRTVVIHNALQFGPRHAPAPAREGIATVGRINDWKGHDVLIEAVARMRDEGHPVGLRIAGDPFPGAERYRAALERRIAELRLTDQVELLGFVDDVPSLLARCAVFVLPSRRPEPFGLALLEAMGEGLPCIATAAGGPRDIVVDGRTGILVPPGDPAALAEALTKLLDDPGLRRRLGEAAAADVRVRFSPDSLLDAVERIYLPLVRHPPD